MSRENLHQRKVYEVTIIKSLAFLAVVFQSSLIYVIGQGNLNPEESVMMGILFNIVKFSAPIFIFVGGFHLVHHQTQAIKYKDYISKKWSELITPYLFWTIIYVILFTNLNVLSFGKIVDIVKAMVTGSAAPHLWYVVMVFQFHILIPIFYIVFKWLEKRVQSKKAIIHFILLAATIYLCLMWVSSNYIFNGRPLTENTWLTYTDRSFLAYSFYFFLGGIAALTLHSWRKFVRKSISVNTFIFLGLFMIVCYELLAFNGVTSVDLKASTYLKPSMFLYITSEILLLYGLSMAIVQARSFLFKMLNFIGKFTYGSYLAHFFFLQVIGMMIPINIINNHFILLSILIFCLTTAASITFSYLMSVLQPGKAFIGPLEKAKRFGGLAFTLKSNPVKRN